MANPRSAAKPAQPATPSQRPRPAAGRAAAGGAAAGGAAAGQHGPVETAVQAAAELAEISLQASARALRRTLSRLPRP